MMRTGRSGDRQSPLRVVRFTARETDWEPFRGLHQGQRPSAPHRRAGHMTAIGQPASEPIKTLAYRGRPHRTLSVPKSSGRSCSATKLKRNGSGHQGWACTP